MSASPLRSFSTTLYIPVIVTELVARDGVLAVLVEALGESADARRSRPGGVGEGKRIEAAGLVVPGIIAHTERPRRSSPNDMEID